jgi:hypothetical protein
LNQDNIDNRAREDVWYLISELFLDSELLERDIDYIARELAAVPFSCEQLNSIYENEVAPALHFNLKQVAGVWGSFNRDEIIPLIRRQASKAGKPCTGFAVIRQLKREFVSGETKDDWKKILQRVEFIRANKDD